MANDDNFSCYDINGVGINQFIYNDDGTVSGLISTGSTEDYNVKTPVSKECCETLNFQWEENVNKCYWSKEKQTPEFKINLGAEENAGAIFQVNDNELCKLEVKLDYLIQFDCETLIECLEPEEDDEEEQVIIENINNIEDQIDQINKQIDELEEQRENSGRIEDEDMDPEVDNDRVEDTDTNIGGDIIEDEVINIESSGIKGVKNQKQNKDTTSGMRINTPPTAGRRNRYDKIIEELEKTKEELQNRLNQLNKELEDIKNNKTNGELGCLDVFKKIDIDLILNKIIDREDNKGIENGEYETKKILQEIHSEKLYKTDNIVETFKNNCNTGLYVTGSTLCKEKLNECLLNSLGDDCDVLSACTLNSNWLTHSFEISDEEVLSAITNEKIKLSLSIKDYLCDYNILIDNIEINKKCSELSGESIYISKCPTLEFEKTIDNKKSWVTSDEKEIRLYDVKDRETGYEIKHHKLAVNTKEISLESSPATAIETDVMCYVKDNPEVLDCSTGKTEVLLHTNIDFESILNNEYDKCKEENKIDGGCEITSTWGVVVKNSCGEVYNNTNFYSGNTIGEYPNQENYESEIEEIAQKLGLGVEKTGGEIKLINNIGCNNGLINETLDIDLKLDIKLDCETYNYIIQKCGDEDGKHLEITTTYELEVPKEIDCTEGRCPEGYNFYPETKKCIKTITGSTYSGGTINIVSTGDTSYGSSGTTIYENDFDNLPIINTEDPNRYEYDNGENLETLTQNNFCNNCTGETRLNKVGIWANPEKIGDIGNNWLKFHKCINIEYGEYSLGIGYDDFVGVKINGTEVINANKLNKNNSNNWHIFNIKLSGGTNLIEVIAKNGVPDTPATVGIEVYSGNSKTMSGKKTDVDVNDMVIWSTSNMVNSEFYLGEKESGYSCKPGSGYALNMCDYEVPTCVKYEEHICKECTRYVGNEVSGDECWMVIGKDWDNRCVDCDCKYDCDECLGNK